MKSCLLALLFVLTAAPAPSLCRFEYARLRMGTSVRIVLYAPDEVQARQAADAAFSRIDDLEAALSHYRPDSEVSRLSASSGRGERRVEPDLFRVLDAACRFSRLTDGAFDVTVGPLVGLWREARRNKNLPDAARLEQARRVVGYQNIEIRRDKHTVRLKKEGMSLDLSAIAKGYAADQALLVLKSKGIASALVDAGGDIALSGPPPGRPGWRVGVQAPDSAADSTGSLLLRNTAIATSGDAYQYVELGGKRYSHILDPRTGLGTTDAASATVIAGDGMTADALATALCVMAPEKGIRLIESLPGVCAQVIGRTPAGLRCYRSAGFPP
ncbi:MAG: FAD:protein FMN transferase [Acidobacteriota bacterium]